MMVKIVMMIIPVEETEQRVMMVLFVGSWGLLRTVVLVALPVEQPAHFGPMMIVVRWRSASDRRGRAGDVDTQGAKEIAMVRVTRHVAL